jgi:predicted lipid-binding transport protein (Tim44 family)
MNFTDTGMGKTDTEMAMQKQNAARKAAAEQQVVANEEQAAGGMSAGGSLLGGIIGAIAAGVVSGGMGAPAGFAAGSAIGGAVGGVAGEAIKTKAPVSGAKIASSVGQGVSGGLQVANTQGITDAAAKEALAQGDKSLQAGSQQLASTTEDVAKMTSKTFGEDFAKVKRFGLQ